MQDKIKVSVFKNTYDKEPKTATLKSILDKIKDSPALTKLGQELRLLATKKDQQAFKQKRIPAITVSGMFKNGHCSKDLIEHSGIIQIDIDNLTTPGSTSLEELKKVLKDDPYTFVLFTSVSGAGLKIFVYIDGSNHGESFIGLQAYYSEKYKLSIDPKCRDVGRLCFLNCDREIYVNEAAKLFAIQYSAVKAHKESISTSFLPVLMADVHKCVCQIEERKLDVTSGYENWLKLGFALGNGLGEQGRSYFHRISCFSPQYNFKLADKQFTSCLNGSKKGISIKSFFQIAKQHGIDIISNTFKQPDGFNSNDQQPIKKNDKNLPQITQVENFLSEHFDFRRNVINEKLEFRKRNEESITWLQVNENAISRFLQKNYFNYSPNKTADLLNSDFVNEYNPFIDYFKNLPAWQKDVEPSYIEKLSGLIKSKDQKRFDIQFKKMLIRCVACAIVVGNTNPNFNKHVFVLVNANQSSGKSTLCRWLCPPQLQDYFLENISFDKDGNIALAQGFLINLDELASLSKYDNNLLKTFISKASINERLPYGKTRKFYPRRANFIGSTNNMEFLIDETGNVRWICFEIENINFEYSDPKSRLFVDIDRLWAEAYTRLLHGEEWQLTTQERMENELSNKTFQLTSEEEELIISNFEAAEKRKEYFATNSDILQKLAIKGHNVARLNSKRLGAVLRKLNFPRGEERIGKYPVHGYYLKDLSK
jgi:predicted P-loop ATPase